MGNRICSVDGCERPHQARGLCKMHWKRWRNHGITDRRERVRNVCSIDGCDAECRGRGLCDMHYQRWKRHGDPTMIRRPVPTKNQNWAEFLRLTSLETDDCIVWLSLTDNGYGRVTVPAIPGPGPGRRVLAHRLALEMRSGPRPEGMEAAHAPVICHNPACINYRHLRWATRLENVLDQVADGTVTRGERSTSRLTADDVRAIRGGRYEGESRRRIALRFGVSPATIDALIWRRTWAWLD